MQISFDFDSPASLENIPGRKLLLYCYDGLSKAAYQAIQVGRALISVIKLPPPADLPVWAAFLPEAIAYRSMSRSVRVNMVVSSNDERFCGC